MTNLLVKYHENKATTYKPKIKNLRHKNTYELTTNDKLKAAIGTTLGTAIPMAVMMKKQGVKNPLKLTYGLKEMLILSSTSILGAVGLSMYNESKETNKKKLNEGLFQFTNATFPAIMVWGGLEICKKVKQLNNVPSKIITTLAGIFAGMKLAASATNKICDPKDLVPDRKHDLKDTLANADDLVGALILAKVPFIDRLKIDKLLPVIYGYCGYRAGKTN